MVRHSLNFVGWKLRKAGGATGRALRRSLNIRRGLDYTTNAIETLSMSLRKTTKNRGSFPSDEALLKLFCLAQQNIGQKRIMPMRNWGGSAEPFYYPVR